jgi:hypothetical protein
MSSAEETSLILLEEFKEKGIKNDNFIVTHFENWMRQLYEYRRRYGNIACIRGTYLCRKGKAYPHIQIILSGNINVRCYDPCLDFCSGSEDVYISDDIKNLKMEDVIGQQVMNEMLNDYYIKGGIADLRRCYTMSFDEYIRFHRKLAWSKPYSSFQKKHKHCSV